ncbi:hypothetical protein B0H14DRAFT_3451884 [Mycena olivaceomarginata]|nr:hypothetical protein B0H14DRAFT_3451884 [Mycena olivaceomarginata]
MNGRTKKAPTINLQTGPGPASKPRLGPGLEGLGFQFFEAQAQALGAWPGSGLPGPGLAGLSALRPGRGHHYPAPGALTARPAIAHQVDLGRPPAADHVPLGSAALGRGKADTLLPELLRPACLRPIRPN